MFKNGKLYYDDKPEKEVKIGKSCYVAVCNKVFYYKAITNITFTDNTFAIATEIGDTKCFHLDNFRPRITYTFLKDGKKFNIDCKVFSNKDEALESVGLVKTYMG
jgi:hypothetical protein